MRALLLNGIPHEIGGSYNSLHIMKEIFAVNGIDSDIVCIGKNVTKRLCCMQ